MPTKEQSAAIKLYANIMAEVKLRIAAIDAGTGGKLAALPAPFIREFSYLQLRMICGLIALGCLVAHGEIVPTNKKSLQKEWSAETIVKALSDLHADFFPIAVRQTVTAGVKGVEGINPPIMTKAEFLELYGRCGGVLHRGNAKKLIKQQMPTQVNFPEITAKAQKILDLLSVHLVVMKGGLVTFICVLSNIDDGMKVQVAILEKREPPEPLKSQMEAAMEAAKK